MVMRGSLIAVFLMMNLNCAEGLEDAKICYILDGILMFYGIILTALYCRLRVQPASVPPAAASYAEKPASGGGIYAGLTPHKADVYETIKVEKRPIV